MSDEPDERSTVLDGVRVLDLSTTVAGAYTTKLLVSLGATVVKVEGPDGDPLRRWSASGHVADAGDGALFRYLSESKRSLALDPRDPRVRELLENSDIVIETGTMTLEEIAELRAAAPATVVVSVTHAGKRGPWTGRPTTEFTLQAASGSIGSRGSAETPPLYAGGDVGEWLAGAYACAVALPLLYEARRTGLGDHADVSMLECLAIATHAYAALKASLGATGFPASKRQLEVPSIEPTKDGFANFTTNSRDQFDHFLVLIDRGDLLGDEELATRNGRQARREEFWKILRNWTRRHTTAEIVELAGPLRIPVAPLSDPDTVTELEQVVVRNVYGEAPGGGYLRPRPPFGIPDIPKEPLGSAPKLGADNDIAGWNHLVSRQEPRALGRARTSKPDLPLRGIRLVEITSWWAGPSSGQLLAALGADVIRIESLSHTDGQRLTSTAWLPPKQSWWETSYLYQAANTNKRSVTLELRTPRGRELALRLIDTADLVVENFSPRVLDGFGITWDVVHARNPRCSMVRMPAFGLDGPWRERTGFAQTMEALSGMAWLTGFSDGPPVLPRGPCDPLAGMHGAIAMSAALTHRERTGQGSFIEVPMVEVVLNATAEIVLERSANGIRLERQGNRGPHAAPQGVYPANGADRWVAIAVATDEQWLALAEAIGDRALLDDPSLRTAAGRREAHDRIDAALNRWTAGLAPAEIVERLDGVPAEIVAETVEVVDNEQLRARGFVEPFDHPLLGHHEVATMPFRLASYTGPWLRTPSPMLGQHNDEVLTELGLDAADIAHLRELNIVGERPRE